MASSVGREGTDESQYNNRPLSLRADHVLLTYVESCLLSVDSAEPLQVQAGP